MLNVKKLDIMYSPLTGRFEHVTGKPGRTVNVAEYTSMGELEKLLEIFGSTVLHIIDEKLSKVMEEYVHHISAVLQQNAHLLGGVLQGGFINSEGLDDILRTASKVAHGPKALEAVIRIGTALNFRGMMRSAARTMLARACDSSTIDFVDDVSQLVSSVPGTLTRGADFHQIKGLLETYSAACARGSGLDFKLLGALSRISNIADNSWDLLPNLLALLLPMISWSNVVYVKGYEGFANNIHCMFSAVSPLLYASQVSSVCVKESKLPTANEDKIESLATAGSVSAIRRRRPRRCSRRSGPPRPR